MVAKKQVLLVGVGYYGIFEFRLRKHLAVFRGFAHRPQSSSFLGVPYRILNMYPQKELLWGPWVRIRVV